MAELGRILAKEMNRKPSTASKTTGREKRNSIMPWFYTRLAELENHLPEYAG